MNDLLQYINKLYGLNINSHEKVTGGFLSENHILTGGDKKYFLKKYRFDNKERIKEVHLVKGYFSKGGIPVILPIVNNDGNTFFCFESNYFALFPFIRDDQFEKGSSSDLAIKSLGETLGRIHFLGKDSKLPVKDSFKSWNKEKALEKIEAIRLEINKKKILTEFDKLALENINTKERLILANEIKFEDFNLPNDHLIHGDYHDQNVFFNKDVTSFVFDFEKAGYAPRLYELFRSLVYSFLDEHVNTENINKARIYLNSYLKIYPTSKEELKKGLKLFYLKSLHSFWVEEEHYLKNNNRVDCFLFSNFNYLKYLSDNFEEFQKSLFEELR